MSRLVLKRLAVGVFVLWGAVTLMFVLLRLAPGDPATLMLGTDASPEQIAQMRTRLGLDQSMLQQYVNYLGQVVRLDFGDSFRFRAPAMEVVTGRLGATIMLTAAATVIAVVVGMALGIAAGRRPESRMDRAVSALAITFQAMPTFWVGIMLVLLFTVRLGVLPSSGTGTWRHLVLPAVSLSMPFIAIVARIARASISESMQSGYIQTARSKGLTEGQTVRGHALRNSMAPVVTIVGLQIGALLGGAVVVENVFAWPGLGSLIVQAVANRDYAVVQAAALLIAGFVVVLNLLTDISYGLIDPRIRVGGRS
ncbi:MAG: ABC transporter permease [Cellulomonas sp.]|jgi:peptide/nickel transport system permease protein|uniref:ABC transporter permease n=1 Tax=Cellulomonas sp. TaxID=40001 RepID=UPI0019ED33A8|nr:ABC transporter permease [Cellulomonas sp.]MBF0688326.1 ABC transporter permease [Cellulomonas sp.]